MFVGAPAESTLEFKIPEKVRSLTPFLFSKPKGEAFSYGNRPLKFVGLIN